LLLALMLGSTALAQGSNPPGSAPLILTDEQGEYPLGLHIELLEDPGGELTIDDVTSPEYAAQFVPSQAPVPNFGFTNSAIWVRLSLRNETRDTSDWLLEQGFANTHTVDLYTPLPGGEGFAVKQTGVLRPATTRDIQYPNLVFNLKIPPQSQQTTYLRFQSGASMTLPLTLWAQTAFMDRALVEQVLMGIFYGVLIGLLFYNLFLLFSLRDLNYLFFVLLLVSIIIEDASYAGYLPVYIIRDLGFPVQWIEPVAFSMTIASMVLFSTSFLELKKRLPKLYIVSLVILAVWGALMLLIPFTSYHFLARLMTPWALISLVAVFISGIASWMGGYQASRFFVLAWLGLVISLIWLLLVRLGLASSTFFSENAFRPGYLWMAVCWSIALADRINLLKDEIESANRDLRRSEGRLAQILDGLPLGVVLYGKDQKPKYANWRAYETLSDPVKGVKPDISAGRTLKEAIPYFSLKLAGSQDAYPLENIPVYSALQGTPALADDIEMQRGDGRVALEIQASPVRDDRGQVESAVVVFQDITQRKQEEAELAEYRRHLEALVERRTFALNATNEQLQRRIDWLSSINLVNQAMARSDDFTQIYANIIEIINKLFSAQGSFIAGWDANTKLYKTLAHACRTVSCLDSLGTLTWLPEGAVTDTSLEKSTITWLTGEQLGALSDIHGEDAQIHSLALVPLRLREQFLGYLGIEFLEDDKVISQEEADLLTIFSTDIAQIIEDTRLYEQMKALIAVRERNRLARDLHDSVTQVLFSATLLAEVLPQIWRRDPEQGMQRLEKLQRLTRGALAEMRAMLLELRPTAVVNTPLSDLMAQLAEAVASRTGLQFQLFVEQIPTLPEAVQINFYRIAQEALNNVVKHAQASQIVVSLSDTSRSPGSSGKAQREVRLVIRDNGVGFAAETRRADQLGINIMQERAAAIQASLALQSRPGHGTQVILIWRNENGSKP
jgi:signal transduction histidine kinase